MSPPGGRGALAAFAGVSFCYFAFAGLFSTYSPLWLQQLGFSALAIGALVSMQSATRLVTPYLWAWLADHSGRRTGLLRIAVAGAIVSSAGFLVPSGYGWIATVCVVLFVCTAGVIPLAEAALAQWVSREGTLDAGRYGRVRLWGSIGFIAAVASAGFALEWVGVRHFPWFVLALLLLLGVAALRLPAVGEAAAPGGAAGGALGKLREPEVAWFFAGVFLTVLAHQGLYAFFSLYLAELGYDKGTIGLIWALGVLVEVGWFWSQGRWFGRLSAHGWLVVAALATALRFAATAAFAAVPVVLVLAQCLHAVTFAAQHTACIAVVNRHFGGHLRGRGQALYTVLGYGCSGVLAGLAGGALAEWAGYAAVLWAGAAAGVLSAACAGLAARAARHSFRGGPKEP